MQNKSDSKAINAQKQFNKIQERAFSKKNEKNFIASRHHALMINYGWIPIEEFMEMPIPAYLGLLKQLEEMYKEINKKR